MVTFSEVVERAMTGPACPEKDYDLRIFGKKLKDVVKKYGITYDRDTKIPYDDGLADDVFKAAIEFYSEVGSYCTSTGRIMRFTEKEIKEAIRNAPPKVTLGEGREKKDFVARNPESEIPPWCSVGGNAITVSSDEIFLSLTQALASIPLADSITTNVLMTVGGKRILIDTPLEIFGSVRSVALTKEGLKRAGKPGLCIANSIASAYSDVGTIAGSHLLGPGDTIEIASIAEMKVDFKLLNKVAHCLNTGRAIIAGYGPVYGGYCGGSEGLAVAMTAYTFQNLLIQRANVTHPYSVHYQHVCNSGSELLWANSLSYQAISRNVIMPLLSVCYVSAGPATEMAFYESAATAIATVASGSSMESVGMRGTKEDYSCSLEPHLASEVGHAAAGMKRKDANEIVKRLLKEYEDRIPNPPQGKRYQECYNVATATPHQEYYDLYEKTRKQIADYGMNLE